MEFNKTLIFTGIIKRVSKSTNKEYKLISFLGDNGQTFTALLDTYFEEDLINFLDKLNVTFRLNVGKFLSLSVIGVELA